MAATRDDVGGDGPAAPPSTGETRERVGDVAKVEFELAEDVLLVEAGPALCGHAGSELAEWPTRATRHERQDCNLLVDTCSASRSSRRPRRAVRPLERTLCRTLARGPSSIRASSYYIGIVWTQSTKAPCMTPTQRRCWASARCRRPAGRTCPGGEQDRPSGRRDVFIMHHRARRGNQTPPAPTAAVGEGARGGGQHGMVGGRVVRADPAGQAVVRHRVGARGGRARDAARLGHRRGRHVDEAALAQAGPGPRNFGKLARALPTTTSTCADGLLVMESAHASGTGLLDTASRQWDDGARDGDGALRSKLPPLVAPRRRRARRAERRRGSGCRRGCRSRRGAATTCERARLRLLGRGPRRHLARPRARSSRGRRRRRRPVGAVSRSSTRRAAASRCCARSTARRCPRAARAAHARRRRARRAEPIGCEGLTLNPYLAGERTPNWPQASGAPSLPRRPPRRPGLVYRAASRASPSRSATASRRCGAGAGDCDEVRLVGGGSRPSSAA